MSMIHLVVSDSIRTSLNGGEHVKEGFSLVATMRRSYERRRHDGSDDDFLVGEGAAAPSAADPASSFEYASLSASAAAAAAMAMPPFAAAAVAAAAVAVPSYDAVAPSTSSSTLSHVASDPDMLFPNKLFVMLHDAHQQGFHDIVSWGKDSYRGFKVHRKRDFERIVLPKYFKMTKYKSFTRQLHNYEFLWIRMGNDKGGYYHPSFDRNDISSCNEITRREQGSPGGNNPRAGKKRQRSDEDNDLNLIMIPEEDRKPGASSGDDDDDDDEEEARMLPAAAAVRMPFAQSQQYHVMSSMGSSAAQWPLTAIHPMAAVGTAMQRAQPSYTQQQHHHYPLYHHQEHVGLGAMPMYPEEQKLAPHHLLAAAALSRSPHPHPLDSSLEPRTIEEMMQDRASEGSSAPPSSKKHPSPVHHPLAKKPYR